MRRSVNVITMRESCTACQVNPHVCCVLSMVLLFLSPPTQQAYDDDAVRILQNAHIPCVDFPAAISMINTEQKSSKPSKDMKLFSAIFHPSRRMTPSLIPKFSRMWRTYRDQINFQMAVETTGSYFPFDHQVSRHYNFTEEWIELMHPRRGKW